jgi:hypothetical protein
MLDFEKLANEFVFLREKLREIAGLVIKNEHLEASFLIGCLHSICHNHAVGIGQLVQSRFEQAPPVAPKEESKNEQSAV